jgi:hypothetical protein
VLSHVKNEEARVILHNLLGQHQPDPTGQRWENGLFVSVCLICRRVMVKPVNGRWQLAGRIRGL